MYSIMKFRISKNQKKGFSLLEVTLVLVLISTLILLINPLDFVRNFQSGFQTVSANEDGRSLILKLEEHLPKSAVVLQASLYELKLFSKGHIYRFFLSGYPSEEPPYSVMFQKNNETPFTIASDIPLLQNTQKPGFEFTYFNLNNEPAISLDTIHLITVFLTLNKGNSFYEYKTTFGLESDDISIYTR